MNRNIDETERRYGVNYRRTVLGSVILAGLLLMADPVIAKLSAAAAAPQVEQAVLGEDWEKVIRLLPKEAEPNLPASLRLIRGHACLATNRNNEALCLFLNTSSPVDLRHWDEWSAHFLERHPSNAIAYYLRGDCEARMKSWDKALANLNGALALDPNLPWALNARGAVYSAQRHWYQAIADFEHAVRVRPGFADVYASRGCLNIQKRGGAEGAVEWFGRALKSSPNFALALNGRGCAHYALGNWDKAKEDFEHAANSTGCLPITSLNLAALMTAKLDFVTKEADLLAQDNPGTEMRTQIQNIQNQIGAQQRGIMGDIAIQTTYGTLKDLGLSGKVGAQLDIGTKMTGTPNAGLKVNGELAAKPDWKGLADFMTGRTSADMTHRYGEINRLETQLGALRQQYSVNPGGVTTDLRKAYVDCGRWPVDTFYGLFYVIGPETTASK